MFVGYYSGGESVALGTEFAPSTPPLSAISVPASVSPETDQR